MAFLVLVTMSEAIVERGFPKMKLIMIGKHTRLDDKGFAALMRISFQSEPLRQHQIEVIIS